MKFQGMQHRSFYVTHIVSFLFLAPRSAITFEPLGCYNDNYDRDMNGLWSQINNNEECFANCLKSGYIYFGTQVFKLNYFQNNLRFTRNT